MPINFLDPENSLAARLNQQNIGVAKGIFSTPTKVPLLSGAFNEGLAPFANKPGFSTGGMRRPEASGQDDGLYDELDTTKMTEEEKRQRQTGAPRAPEFFPTGSPANRFLETAGAVASAIPKAVELIPRAAANALLPEGMRLQPAPEQTTPAPRPVAAPVQTAPAPKPTAAPAQTTPVPKPVAAPVAEGMRAPRLNVLGEPVQTLDQQGGYKVFGPQGAVATEIPWNPTDESALRRTLTRDEYLSVFNPELAAGSRTAATNASNEAQQRIQADASRDVAGIGMQRARQVAEAGATAEANANAVKRLDQLSPMILGQMDQKTGEFLPGALDEGEDTATAVFKQSLLDAGIPAAELSTTQFRWDKDRRIMQVLDADGNVVQEGSPTGLGKQAYQRYFGRV